MRGVFLAAVLVTLPAVVQAEPIEDRAYTAGCGEEGCFLQGAGFTFFVSAQGNPPQIIEELASLPLVRAVAFEGEMSNMGDSSADLTLTKVSPVDDDVFEGNLQVIQGNWKPVGEETPFHIGIYGLTWQEFLQDEPGVAFAMTPGEACADGVVPGGMTISLYRLGDDPGADACWQLEYADDATMLLRDFMGEQGQVEFERMN